MKETRQPPSRAQYPKCRAIGLGYIATRRGCGDKDCDGAEVRFRRNSVALPSKMGGDRGHNDAADTFKVLEMPMSEYVKTLRATMGHNRLLLPSVSALIYDDVGRLLLVRQRDGDAWSTPGGAIEFDETPADAVVRETWEEAGLLVSVVRIFGIYGGPNFVVHYDNGDEAQYVMTAFECKVLGGALQSDGVETIDVRFWGADERPALAPWLRSMFPIFLAREANAFFEPAVWTPPA